MKITFCYKSDARIGFSLKLSVQGAENQPNRSRYGHVAGILSVAEDASTFFGVIMSNNQVMVNIPNPQGKYKKHELKPKTNTEISENTGKLNTEKYGRLN